MLKIYFENDSERREMESIERGCRLDVLVESDGKFYEPVINTIDRLVQEVQEVFAENKIYFIDPCQIIVQEANKKLIVESIIALHRNGFFNHFSEINLCKYEKISARLTDIRNWVRIY